MSEKSPRKGSTSLRSASSKGKSRNPKNMTS
jgi:hypothetical protein